MLETFLWYSFHLQAIPGTASDRSLAESNKSGWLNMLGKYTWSQHSYLHIVILLCIELTHSFSYSGRRLVWEEAGTSDGILHLPVRVGVHSSVAVASLSSLWPLHSHYWSGQGRKWRGHHLQHWWGEGLGEEGRECGLLRGKASRPVLVRLKREALLAGRNKFLVWY